MRRGLMLMLLLALAACRKPGPDTSTPEATLDAAVAMVREGRVRELPMLIEIPARDVTFDDGVTEASAIGEVKQKAGAMLERVVGVAARLRQRFPGEVAKEVKAASKKTSTGVRDQLVAVLGDPAAWIEAQRPRLKATDLGDGTAALSFDGQPVFAGALSLANTDDGWRFRVPVELLRDSPYWPDTRHEWSVIASMMLAVEHAIEDFQRDLDGGKITSLDMASSRVGRLVGESVAVQSIIYAMMKRPETEGAKEGSKEAPASAPSSPAAPAKSGKR